MRRFLFVSHTVPPSGDWHLEDLTGQAGRVDVICRNIQGGMFLSHGLRADVEIYVVIVTRPSRPVAVRIQSAAVKHLNPDERSTAARIKQALKAAWSVPEWKEVQSGLHVAPFGLDDVLARLAAAGVRPVLLDPTGTPLAAAKMPDDPIFILSDHRPFTEQEYTQIDAMHATRISLGTPWYHGNHAVAVLNWHLDGLGWPAAVTGDNSK